MGGMCFTLGCQQTTTDPRKGGLFGYNPDAYEKRLQERRSTKDELERQQTAEEQKTRQLQGEIALKESEKEALQKQIADLDDEIARIEIKMATAKLDTEEQKRAQWKISTKLQSLKGQLTTAKSPSNPATTAKKKEVERLKKEIDRLLEEAEALSTL